MTASSTDVPRSGDASRVPHRWRNLATMSGVTVVDNTEAGLSATLFPSIAAALKLDSGHLGVLSAMGKVIGVPAGPAWTALAARIGRRNALIATTVTGGLFGIAAGFSQNFTQLLIFNSLMAACIIGGSPIANAVIMDSFEDSQRAKATGYFYGSVNGIASFLGPAIALFTGINQGWRYGMWSIGAICLLAGIAVALFFRDPGVGASESQLAGLQEKDRAQKVSVASVLGLFRIPTFSVMMISRLLSGHLLITIFGIQFLVTERGFSNTVAATVLLPFGLGYVAGTVVGGLSMGPLDRILPDRGRVFYIQAAQVFFALAAFGGTQIDYGNTIVIYGIFWALMGAAQGMNPSVNRPIVASVVTPEVRGQAFAIFITVFETLGWAVFSLGAGQLADSIGIQEVFLWFLVGLMLVNAVFLGLLHLTYPRDVRAVKETLESRRTVALND